MRVAAAEAKLLGEGMEEVEKLHGPMKADGDTEATLKARMRLML